MFCDRCGSKLTQQAQACHSCGKPVSPLMPRKAGIAGHVRLLGILWLSQAALHIGPGLLIVALFSSRVLPPEVPAFVSAFLPLIGWMLVITGAANAAVGAGLLMRQSWARIAALIMGAISLINIPLGTALGIYTLWALLPADHEQQYRELTRVA